MASLFEIFGLRFKDDGAGENVSSVVPDRSPEKGIEITTSQEGVATRLTHDFNSYFSNQKQKIELYRELEENPYVDEAIQEIVDEMVVKDDQGKIVSLDLSETELSRKIKDVINYEFAEVLNLLDFSNRASHIVRRWYVDGQISYYKVVNKEKLEEGIKEVRLIDSRFLQKVTQVKVDRQTQIRMDKETFYVYFEQETEKSSQSAAQTYADNQKKAIRLNEDAVAFTSSGLYSRDQKFIRSYLQKAIKPANQLTQLEDALLVYRISRAPERLVFYVDTGELPAKQSTSFVEKFAKKFINKATYNEQTGKVENSAHLKTMVENYWLPRKEGNRGTEISSISSSGGGIQNDIEMLEYFKQKLYKAMHIPLSRMREDSMMGSRSSEITREEIKFSKFIGRLRSKFEELLIDLLRTQLILKRVITPEEWVEFEKYLKLFWESDSVYAEMKNQEIIESRLRVLRDASEYVRGLEGYFSKGWVQRNILNMTEDEISQIEKESEEEIKTGRQPDPSERGRF